MANNRIKILVIDDFQDNLIILNAMIKDAFPEAITITAMNGKSGLELAAKEDPDVILLDIIMPEMDGYEVCQKLKADKKLRDIPVVFVTAIKDTKVSLISALESGGEAFLTKPIDDIELAAQLRAMLKIRNANIQKRDEKERLTELVEEKTSELNKAYVSTLNLLEDLKKENEARIKSEEQFRLAMNASNDGLFDWNLETNSIYYSPRWKKMLGYEDHELPNDFTVWEKTTDPEDVKKSWELQQKLISGEVDRFVLEFKMKHKDGYWVDILSRAEAIFNDKGKAIRIVGTHTDITKRKLNETKLVESEDRFKIVAESAGEWIWEVDNEGMYTYSSPMVENILGYTPEEMVGKKHFFDIFQEDVKEQLKEGALNAFKQKQVFKDFESTCVHKNGQTVILNTSGSPFLNKAGDLIGYHGAASDITDRVEADKQKQEEAKKKQLILETAMDGFWITDMKGNLKEVNEAYCKISGYTKDELLTMNISDLEALEIKKDTLNRINQIKKHGETFFETKHTQKNGNNIDVEVSVKYHEFENGQMVCFIHDITERKYSEKKLLLNEKRLDSLLQLNQMTSESFNTIHSFTLEKAVEITNSNIGFLGFVNYDCTIVTIFNWSGSAMKECKVKDYGFEFEVEKAGIWGEVIRTGQPLMINNYSDPNPMKQGIPIGHVKLKNYLSIPVFSEDKIVAVVAVANKESDYKDSDIKQLTLLLNGMWKFTQEQNDKKALKIALDKATESDRLKSAFLANMSHEIRTPMNGILGFADLLKKPNLSGEEQQKYIGIIEKGGARMLNIINNIVSISKIESGQEETNIQESNINEQVEYIYTFFKPQVEDKGMQFLFKNSLPLKEAIIQTDREKVYAILTNLVKNAIKYSDIGSIEFGYNKKDNFFEFYVKDTGIGIPKERQEVIFDRFIQADIEDKNAYQGAGLGLSISKAYVEMLGGKIWVESEEGRGSTFYFTLPNGTNVNKENSVKNENLQQEDIIPISNLKILIAEDEDVSEEYIRIIVQEFGEEIISVGNGIEAVETCRKNPDIDLVLMDIKMPEMDGYEATREIRKFNKDVIIIAQTAYALMGDRENATTAGCNDHISKPIRVDELESLIQKYFKDYRV